MTNERAKALQSAIYWLCQKQPFYGALLQCLNIRYTEKVPTAGITFNKNLSQYEIHLNTKYFCNLDTDQRTAVLQHEVLHFSNKHLFRLPFLTAPEEDRFLYNMAGDMAINQYISNLPEGCIDVKDWVDEKNTPFPTFQSMETYYELLKTNKKANEKNFKSYTPFDVHDWSQLDEETKKIMVEEAKKLIKRTIEKTSTSHDRLDKSIKDLLEELEVMTSTLNCKQILQQTLKRTVSVSDREGTWNRPNKRYGSYAPGTKLGTLPNLSIFCDTSGSISHTELNEFLTIINKFLKVGSRSCLLYLWHTNIYHKRKFKLRDRLASDQIEAGGTCVEDTMKEIKRTNPNLSIIFTDLYFDAPNVLPNSEVIWIVSKGGNKNHGFPKSHKVIYLDNLEE